MGLRTRCRACGRTADGCTCWERPSVHPAYAAREQAAPAPRPRWPRDLAAIEAELTARGLPARRPLARAVPLLIGGYHPPSPWPDGMTHRAGSR